MSKFTHVGLSLENCEYLVFDREYIEYLYFNTITSQKSMVRDEIWEMKYCEDFLIVINKDGNKENEESTAFNSQGSDWNFTPFERIETHSDVVSVGIHYEDGTEEDIYIPWGDDDYTNTKMSIYIDEAGSLHITASEKDVDNDSE